MVESILNCFIYIRDSFRFLFVRLKTFIWKVFKIELLLNFLGIEVNSLFYLRLSVCMFFSFLPFRLLGFLNLPFMFRLGLGLFFGFLVFNYSPVVLPTILNHKVFQSWFYYSLCIDEKLKTLDPIWRIFTFIVIVFSVSFVSFFVLQTGFLIWLSLICWSFYCSLKISFVNLLSDYCFISLKLDPSKRDYFVWLDILENMDFICFMLFKKYIKNKLSKSVEQTQFRYLVRTIIPTY